MNDLETANALMNSGQTEEGLDLLKEVLKKADDGTRYKAGMIYQEYGFIDEAQAVYGALLRRHPNNSNLLVQMSEILIDKGEENQAIDYLQMIHSLDENYLSAQLLLADLYQLQGLDEVAENKLLGALKMAPHEPVLLFALGEFYLSIGEPHEAVRYYKQVLNASVLAHENVALKLAEALSLCGEFEQASLYYQKGLKQGKTLDGLFGYAVTAARLHKFKTTIQTLEELKALDPGYSTLYPVLAHAYEHEGDLNAALKTVEEGLIEDQYNERLYSEAGKLAAKLHDWKKAAHYYQAWFEEDPENLEALTRLVEIQSQQENYEDIIQLLDNQLFADPMLTWFLATAYNKTENVELAERTMNCALQPFRKILSFCRNTENFFGS
ncbi:hypothetical protein QS257_10780 [Terrilactibacillus sp. S3-3]|nr:hypothetical protein QS257_10780 [Terrilactibacillus sp. S3-3]